MRYPRGTSYGASAFAVRDLVYQRPATCPPSLTDPALSTFVAYADGPPPYVLVGSDGRFPFGSQSLYGSITGATHATMLQSFRHRDDGHRRAPAICASRSRRPRACRWATARGA